MTKKDSLNIPIFYYIGDRKVTEEEVIKHLNNKFRARQEEKLRKEK